jgi:GrpB-like predicted nucleotidyltransferase (UPF0157 family)
MRITALLRRRQARLLWLGQVASVTGDRLYGVALIWITLRLTGSPAAVGLVALANTLPFLAASLVSGAVVDRRDGLRLARMVDISRVLLVGAIPFVYLTGHLNVVALAVIAAALSGLEAFFLPALQANLPRLVGPESLTPMVSLLDSTDRLGRVLGPGAIGLLVAVPEIHLFTIDAVSFVVSAVCITVLLKHAAAAAAPGRTATESRTAQLTAGWREIWRRPLLRRTVALRCACNLAWPAYTLGVPFLVADRYHGGIGAYGLVLGAFGAGNLLGTSFTARIKESSLVRWCSIAWAFAGLGFLALALAPQYWLFVLFNIALGVCTPLANVTIDAYIAHTLAPQILARTYTAQRFLVVGAGAAALPAAASLINHAGPAVTLAIAAAAITAAAITALLLQPRHPALHIHVHHRPRTKGTVRANHARKRTNMPRTANATANDSAFGRARFGRGELGFVRLWGVIQVVDYDPTWPRRFEQLRWEYADALAAAGVPVVAIEHVGSTSVPGLAAKPVIDCDIVVAEQDVPAASETLVHLGFTPLGELGIPLRWAFKEPGRLAGTNTYVVVDGCLSLRNHLAVRDILRSDPVLREEYAAVKRRVGAAAGDIDEYGRGKNAIVQRILAAAELTEDERASIDAIQVPSRDEVPR